LTSCQICFAASSAWPARRAASRAAFSVQAAAFWMFCAICCAFCAACWTDWANLARLLTGDEPFLMVYRLPRNSVA
jgi:hypothetical protein